MKTCLQKCFVCYFQIEIPEISLNVPIIKFGDDVKLEASVDIGVSHFIWLKKKHRKNTFKILGQKGKHGFGEMRKISYDMTKFSKDDEGQYQLVVATKQTVGRKTFQLHAGQRNHLFMLPL